MANKEGTGAIFSNEKKSASSPDFNGFIVINGERVEFAGWWQTSAKGQRYISISKSRAKKEPKVEEKPKEQDQGLFDCPDFEDDFNPF